MTVGVHPRLPKVIAKPGRVPGGARIDFNLNRHGVWPRSGLQSMSFRKFGVRTLNYRKVQFFEPYN